MNPSKSDDPVAGPVTLWQTILSVLAAFFGVQSSAVRKRDFSQGRPAAFVVVALSLTLIFVAVLFVIVRVIVHQAAA